MCCRREGLRVPASWSIQLASEAMPSWDYSQKKEKLELFKLEFTELSTLDKLGILILSAPCRVLCAKSRIQIFVSSLLVAKVKLTLGNLTRL